MENQHHIPWEQWLDRATADIRFKPDREEVRAELSAHLEDKALDFQRIFPGLTEDEAQERAAAEMGDPEEIGKELARIHKPWLGYIWRASQVLLGLVLLSFLAEVGTLAPHAGIRSDREAESAWVVEAAFAGQEPVRINNYTLWVEEAALIQGMGELHITWRAASPRFSPAAARNTAQAQTAMHALITKVPGAYRGYPLTRSASIEPSPAAAPPYIGPSTHPASSTTQSPRLT